MNKILKAKMCWLMLAIMLFSFSNKILSQTVNLGILESFEGYTGAGAITNAAGATWTGDAGTNVGIISGLGMPPFFNGNTYSANTVTAQCRVDLFRLYIHLNDLFVDYPATHAPAFGAGETITPGVYSIPGAGSIGAVLNLDGGGNPNAFFIIKFYGAMTVGAGTTISLIGGTKSSNVFFIADGAISVAANTNLKGTLFAKVGAVGLGAGAVLEGRMLTLEGAIVAGVGAKVSRPPGTCTIPIFCESNCGAAPAVDVLGVLSNYALYTNLGSVPNTGTSGIDGNIGTNAGAISGFESSVVVGAYHTADASTSQANIDLDNAYNSLMALPNTVLTHAAAFGTVASGGETINAGVYFIGGAGSLGGMLVLDGQNKTNAIFVFKFAGAFSVAAQAKMILINGAQRCNVFFIGGAGVPTGAISIGAGAVLKGTFLSHGGACGSGASVFLAGRQLSTGGAVVTYSGIIYNNPVCITSTSLEPPIAPTGNSPQTFCSSANPTVSNLIVTATGTVIWYTAATGGSVVTASTALVNGTHYYASQKINNSESTTRFDVTVILNTAPAITTQPTAPSATCSGTGTQTLSVTATGTGLTYSWRKGGVAVTNGTVISGQGANTLTLTSPTISDAGSYDVIVSGSCTPSVTSSVVIVIINSMPAIIVQPTTPAATCSGIGTQTLSVTATGTGLTYSWRKGGVAITNGTVISGQGTNALTLTSPIISDAGSYDVIVISTCTFSVISSVVSVTVNSALTISSTDITGVYNGTGTCTASVSFGSNVSTTGTPAPTLIYKFNVTSITSPYIFPVGTSIVTVYATNSCKTASSNFAVTVNDNQNPTIATLPAISVPSDAGVCTYASAQLTKPTTGDNCIVASVVATPAILAIGANTITWTVTDGSGNTATSTQTVTVTSIKTTTTVTISPNPRQYSDEVTFVARVTSCGENVTGGIVTFRVGTQIMGTAPVLADGTATLNATLNERFITAFTPPAAPIGQMSPGVKTVTASFTAINSSQASTGSTSLIITQEDAIPYYTGSSFVITSSTSSICAAVLLSAKVKDIAAVTGSGDNKPGNIRNARVRFVNRDIADPMNINAVTSATGYYISDWLTPVLAITTDTTTGTVSANWSAPIGCNVDGIQFTLGIIIDNGYYIRNSSTDDAVINISKPLTAFVTGGGYINMTNSIGCINPQQGLRNNFGFIIKSNSNGVLNGNLNSIIRCTNGKVYQVKANAMVSLSVTPATSTSGAKAVFTGKANWQDITNPSRPISAFFGTNLLQVTVTDRGEPGNTDDISIVMWDNGNNLLFSSNWDGTRTVPQVLDGGNIKIHNTASVITGSAQSIATITSSINPAAQGLSVKFTATITSSNSIKPTGTVTFVDVSNNNLILATIALSTTGIVSYSTSSLTVGAHSIISYYSGDSRYGVSSNQITQFITGVTSLKVTPIVVAKVATTKVEYIPLQIAIGPVPSTGKFTLQVLSSSNEIIDMIVLDIFGQVIQKIKLANGSTTDFGSNYLVGSYFLQVIQGKQKVFRKIIKS